MATSDMQPTSTERGPGLGAVLELVRRRRALALLPFLFVLTAAASLAIFLPGVWTGRASILVDRQQISEQFVKSAINNDLDSRLVVLGQDIMSTPRLAGIIEQYNLYPRLRGKRSADQIVERMRKDIRMDLGSEEERANRSNPRTLAFRISYSAPDPRTAMAVTNTLASLYIQENGKLREKQAQGAADFLDVQLEDLRKKLSAQEAQITAYKEKFLGELPEQKDANLRMLESLQNRLQMAHENNRRAVERKYSLTQGLAELDLTTTSNGTIVGPTGTEGTAARLAILRQELDQMQTRYSDRYPDVVALKEQIATLEARKKSDDAVNALPRPGARRTGPALKAVPQNSYVQALMQQQEQASVDAKTTGEEIGSLNRQIAMYQRRLENTPKREGELALIARDYDTTRLSFQTLLAKRNEATVAADLEQRRQGEGFRILEPATLPERPAGPNRVRLFLVGLVLALGAAAVAVVLAENIDTSFRRVDEVRSTFAVPILSTIPRIITEHDRYRATQHRRFATAAVAVGALLVMGSSFLVAHNNEALVSLLTPSTTSLEKK
jgi:polysaccharide chain length determinant protein (PEP-CTERM system associated)